MFLCWFAQATELRMLVSKMPYFVEVEQNDNLSGYAVELGNQIIRQAGHHNETSVMPVARLLHEVKSHPDHTLTIVNRTRDREQNYYWITPLAASPVTLYVRRQSPLAAANTVSMGDVPSASVVRNEYRHGILNQYKIPRIMAVASWHQAVEAVLRGRVESVLFSPLGLALVCQEAGLDCSELVPVMTLQTQYSYLAMPKTAANREVAEQLCRSAIAYKVSPAFGRAVSDLSEKFQSLGQPIEARDGVFHIKGFYPETVADDLWIIAAKVPYFVEQGERGRLQGYGAHLIEDILTEASIKQQILIAPWERIIREASTKSNVMAFAVARTPERESLFHWITPMSRAQQGFYGLGHERFDSIEALPRHFRIATLQHDYRIERSRQAGLITLGFDGISDAIQALYAGQVDAVYTSSAGLQLGCKALQRSCDDISLIAEDEVVTTYLVLSRQGTDPALVERLTLAAERVKQSDRYRHWAALWSRNTRAKGLNFHIHDGVVNIWADR